MSEAIPLPPRPKEWAEYAANYKSWFDYADWHRADAARERARAERAERELNERQPDRLMLRNAELRAARDRAEGLLRECRDRIKHTPLCCVVGGYSHPCNCGAESLYKRIDAALAAAKEQP